MRSLSAPMHFPTQSYLEFTWCTWMHHLCLSNSDTDSRQKQRTHKWSLITLETVSRHFLLHYDYLGTKLSLINLWDLLTKQKMSSHLALGVDFRLWLWRCCSCSLFWSRSEEGGCSDGIFWDQQANSHIRETSSRLMFEWRNSTIYLLSTN